MQSNKGLCKIYHYRFRPKLLPTLATLMLLPLLISLGQWQANKAASKQRLQQTYDQRGRDAPLILGSTLLGPEDRYSKVQVRGRYEPEYQILLDNQIHQGKAGYQVVTPLQIEDSEMRVLVYRGWVPVGKDRNVLPEVEPPQGLVAISGFADKPSGKYIELGDTGTTSTGTQKREAWQQVWQNLDMRRYEQAVPFPLQTQAVRLDADAAGGYVRDWTRPSARIEVHRGYAFQWYAMAVMLVLYYVFTQTEKIGTGKSSDAEQ